MTELILKNRFEQALDRYRLDEHRRYNIGTYKEKTLHMVVKYFTQPDESFHEVRVGRLVADIKCDDKIYEIQTRDFNRLRHKLEVFLPDNRVTVIYPVARTKHIAWVNVQTAEISKSRKSPRHGSFFSVFPELYRIKEFLPSPNLSLRILLLDVTDFRLLNGKSADGKKGSTRYDRVPSAFVSLLDIETLNDYEKLIPASLPETFTSADFARAASLPPAHGSTAVNVLYSVGVLSRVGKIKNAYIYERCHNEPDKQHLQTT